MKTTGFKGFEIADKPFARETSNCSECLSDQNCGLRNCRLEVYHLGSDSIYSGGLCPKGNTNLNEKQAPNYTEQYNKMLDTHLSKLTLPLEQETQTPRILIPRSLSFLNEKGIFYSAIYNTLGFDVSVSPCSNEEIAALGSSSAHPEACYPTILSHGHATFLRNNLRQGLDKLFLVNAIGAEKRQLKFCPYVASSGYVIKGSLDLDPKELLLPVIYFNDPSHPIHKAIKRDLDRVFEKHRLFRKKSFPESQVREAVKEAEKKQEDFIEEVYQKGDEIVSKLKSKGVKIFVGIGRGYTLFDSKANSRVHELFSQNNLHFVPSNFIRPQRDIDIDSLVDNLYWVQGRKMIGYTVQVAVDPAFYYVRLENFNCGTDSITLYYEEDIMSKANKPYLNLQTEHNSNAQFGTRILANNEVVKTHKPNKDIKISSFIFHRPKTTNLENRIIGMPYMGDDSDIGAAAFRAAGLNTQVMPSQTLESITIAKKFVTTNVCRPFSFQVGDHLAWIYSLEKQGIDPNESAALFLPKAGGPCRFGQYPVLLRKFLDSSGFTHVPIIDPDSKSDYLHAEIGEDRLRIVLPLSFKGAFANDVLENATLRTRPYEKQKGETNRQYAESHSQLIKLVETNPKLREMREFMRKQAERFESISSSDERYPLVLINGEIFVRCHEKANQDSIKMLEENELEVMLEPVTSWLRYVNENALQKAWQRRDFTQMKKSFLKKMYMDITSKTLFKPFKNYLAGREFHNPIHNVRESDNNLIFSSAVEGESPVSVGEAYAFVNNHLNIDGIYHVGPHGCMQETVATSRIQSIIQSARKKAKTPEQSLFPFLDAVFGESSIANLESSIALFAQNCRLKRDLRIEKMNI